MEEKNISESVDLETRWNKILRGFVKYISIFLVILIIVAIFINVSEESLFILGEMSDIICWTLYGFVLFFSIIEIVLLFILKNNDKKKNVKTNIGDNNK